MRHYVIMSEWLFAEDSGYINNTQHLLQKKVFEAHIGHLNIHVYINEIHPSVFC